EDLTSYDVIWSDALVADIDNGYAIATAPWPNGGGVAMIEAQNLAEVSGLTSGPHWTESAASLRTALDIGQLLSLVYLPPAVVEAAFPGIDFSPEARVTRAHAEQLWARI